MRNWELEANRKVPPIWPKKKEKKGNRKVVDVLAMAEGMNLWSLCRSSLCSLRVRVKDLAMIFFFPHETKNKYKTTMPAWEQQHPSWLPPWFACFGLAQCGGTIKRVVPSCNESPKLALASAERFISRNTRLTWTSHLWSRPAIPSYIGAARCVGTMFGVS